MRNHGSNRFSIQSSSMYERVRHDEYNIVILYRNVAVFQHSHTMSASKQIHWMDSLCHFFTTWHHQRATSGVKFGYKNGSNFHEKCNLSLACPYYNKNHQSIHIMKLSTIFTVVASVLGHTMTNQFTSKYCPTDKNFNFLSNILIS